MKTKLVLWGANAQSERVLIAMQLRSADNKVDIWTFPEAITTPDFAQQMLNDWRNDAPEIAFPEGFTKIERELTVAESILPDDLKAERPDIIQRAQTEWHFIVLSTKLHESYKSELAEINDKVTQLTEYSGEVWNSLKGFWTKVQEQVRERNLFREHADVLRDTTNVLFEEMKQKRTTLSNEFEGNSSAVYAKFNEVLDEIEKKVEQGINRFPSVFEDLKKTQSQFRDQKLTKDHSNEIWTRIDTLFKTVKEKKFGSSAINDSTAGDRHLRRLEGLIGAIDKMQYSIDRDQEDLDFQAKRVSNSQGQLEAQIRQAKINMVSERIKSKVEKLNEMLVTKAEVESKMNSFKEKEARNATPTPVSVVEKVAPVAPVVAAVAVPIVAQVAAFVAPKVERVAPVVEPIVAALTPSTPSVLAAAKAENVDSEIPNIVADAYAASVAVEKLG